MKLREKQEVILNEYFIKKRRKLQAKHETRTFFWNNGRNVELIPARMTIYYICIFCFWNARSSRWQMFFKIDALENSGILTGKAPVLESPFNKVVGLHTCNFIKNRLQHRCFPVMLAKFLTSFFNRARSVSIVHKKTDEWYIEWQRMTTNDNE